MLPVVCALSLFFRSPVVLEEQQLRITEGSLSNSIKG